MAEVRAHKRMAEKKYQNHAQLVQGVCQVNDKTLTLSERCFLSCLAAYSVKTYPHPGNDKLMVACGVTTRQGVNAIANRLIHRRRLIEVLEVGNGRGKATVYRICTEDPRFPLPKPATVELLVSDEEPATVELSLPVDKPATRDTETRNSHPLNPQLDPEKPATLALHTDVKNGFKNGFKNESAAIAADCNHDAEPSDEERIASYLDKRQKLLARASTFGVQSLDRSFQIGHPKLWERIQPQTQTALIREDQNAPPIQSTTRILCPICRTGLTIAEWERHDCTRSA